MSETNKMTLQEAYRIMFEASGIEEGDTVKVLRKAQEDEMGWNCPWNSEGGMDQTVGHTGKVVDVHGDARGDARGVRVEFGGPINTWWQYPFYVLEIIEKAKPERKDMAKYKSKIVAREEKVDTVRVEDFDADKIYAFYHRSEQEVYRLHRIRDEYHWIGMKNTYNNYGGHSSSSQDVLMCVDAAWEIRQFPTPKDFRRWVDEVCED